MDNGLAHSTQQCCTKCVECCYCKVIKEIKEESMYNNDNIPEEDMYE